NDLEMTVYASDTFFPLDHLVVNGQVVRPGAFDSPVSEVIVDNSLAWRVNLEETVTSTPQALEIQAFNSDDPGGGPPYSVKLDTDCPPAHAVVVAMGLFSNLDSTKPTTSITTASECSGNPSDPSPADGFSAQASTNACDYTGRPDGNLVAYLESRGYKAATKHPGGRGDPGRTLL